MGIPRNHKYQALNEWILASRSFSLSHSSFPSTSLSPYCWEANLWTHRARLHSLARPSLLLARWCWRHLLFQILQSRGNTKNQSMKPFKYRQGWAWQCYSKLNFNETQKMLNLRKVYQRKGHLKDSNAPGPRCRHRRITTCQGHLKVKDLQTAQTSRCEETSPSANMLAFSQKAKQMDTGFFWKV